MFKVSIVLGLLLLASGVWIKSLNNVIAGLQANQIVLETEMIETRVNRASKRVFDNLVKLTDPSQFDEKEDEEVNKPD